MCDDAEVFARGCGYYYDLDIRRCQNAITNGTTCPPAQRQRVRYPQDDHNGKCKSCEGQSPPDSTWYTCVNICTLYPHKLTWSCRYYITRLSINRGSLNLLINISLIKVDSVSIRDADTVIHVTLVQNRL